MSTKNSDNLNYSNFFVQTLAKGLEVIQTFSEKNPSQTISQIAKITDISKPSVRRILLTLEHLGYVSNNNGLFSLTPRILTLGYAYLASQDIWNIALPLMRKLVEKTGESCSISVLDSIDIIYVARVPTKRIMSINLNVGSRLPAYATSMGHVLLANLPEEELAERLNRINFEKFTKNTIANKEELLNILHQVKVQGWAGVEQQFEEGLRSIAVPIRNYGGKVIAAINCSAHAGRISNEVLIEDFLPLLKETAENISNTIPSSYY